ncbi:MAG TPA: nucleotidyl transferase AbiEii/AbiGii toxin family protein [Candidatus Bilamarchaeaceae archaeon]|nr:nucleotidyl transferase AbiEii/AbiGii toxin family protein [Candidatus Bilamarchaeaceae archaeon]
MNKDFEKRSNEVFEVLAILAKLDKQIVFLGGSAIQAILPEQKRLSIDLDISYFGETDKLIHELQSAGYSVVKRKGRNPIFVFYTVTKKDVMVKLDITHLIIPETEKRRFGDFETLLPTQSYFIASKLSSLAFGTIGRLGEEQSQIIKDIFDINCLLDNKPSLDGMKENWHKIIYDQNRLRNTNHKEVQCIEDVQKTLLKCIEVMPSPSFFITPNSLGSFQDTLVKGRISRQDLVTMAARVLLLLVYMDNNFYDVETRVLSDATDTKKLEEAEKTLLAKQILKTDQLHALKIIAPKALLYLFFI